MTDIIERATQALDSVKALVKETESGTKESVKAAMDKADKLAKDVTAVSDRLLEAEQKLVEGVKSGKTAPKSLGLLVVESDEYKNHVSGKNNKFTITLKGDFDVQANTITGQTGSPPANSTLLK